MTSKLHSKLVSHGRRNDPRLYKNHTTARLLKVYNKYVHVSCMFCSGMLEKPSSYDECEFVSNGKMLRKNWFFEGRTIYVLVHSSSLILFICNFLVFLRKKLWHITLLMFVPFCYTALLWVRLKIFWNRNIILVMLLSLVKI